jgi:DNA-binding beta-propeller fold protein YncE
VNRINATQIALLQWYQDPGVAATYPSASGPRGVAFDGSNIWVTNTADDTVSRISPSTGAKTDHPTGDTPVSVAFDGTHIWVTNSFADTVSKINPGS